MTCACGLLIANATEIDPGGGWGGQPPAMNGYFPCSIESLVLQYKWPAQHLQLHKFQSFETISTQIQSQKDKFLKTFLGHTPNSLARACFTC